MGKGEVTMFCPRCGKQNEDQARYCQGCGEILDMTFQAPPGPPPRYPEGAPASSGLAIASLILGLLSFCPNLLTAISAVICGHLALERIKRSEGILSGRGMAIAGLALGYFGIVFGIIALPAWVLPAWGRARELARRNVCQSNLKQIHNACSKYAAAHEGMFPDNLTRLVTDGFLDAHALICPSAKDQTSAKDSYLYTAGLGLNDDSGKLLVSDKPGNHQGEGRNELYVDGAVQWNPHPEPEQGAMK